MLYSGYIREVLTRDYGGKKFYTAVLSTGDKIGFGAWPPKELKEGLFIEVNAEKNDKGYLQGDKKTFKVSAPPKEAVSSGASASSVGAVSQMGVTSGEYWNRKDARDVRNDRLREVGASRNTAIEWIKFLVSQGAFKLSKKPDEIEDQLNTLLDDYTNKFLKESNEEKKNNKDAEESADGNGSVGSGADGAGDAEDWST